ncbi:GNAT family N-acetyltransferase [Erysipelothrix sp. HDW6C]|uniref:GNAT family N-acetyltransferase n=1 Tax=Erysipelothrix sp. HDW6C TaxID=2714930 RepID=UPI0014093301|nr:GNAT family N-acetyltransferase [Erysipelothrix sp. HDW6C]QIK68974.1 GNAT family N-acetyltransferase [Erysipelothrix sp. HDW6C]
MQIKKTEYKDLVNVQKLWNHPEVMKYVGFPDGLGITFEALESWIKNIEGSKISSHFSIYDDTLGYCGETFYRLDYENDFATLDIKVLPHAMGKGIAAYALSYVIDTVLNKTGVSRCCVDPSLENKDALRLYAKLGFIAKPVPTYYRDADTYFEVTWKTFKPSPHYLKDSITLEQPKASDMERLWELSAKESYYPWTELDAPYFNEFEMLTFEDYLERDGKFLLNSKTALVIRYNDAIVGCANYYWENKDTRWLEFGMDIFDDAYWSKGIARTVAIEMTQRIFDNENVDRVGFTTWSGNFGMMRVGDILGFKREKVVRRARYHKGVYYDSVGYGITREEWNCDHHFAYQTQQIFDAEKKSEVCAHILELLPEWFGIPESTEAYVEEVKAMVVYAVYDQAKVIGFTALNYHAGGALEIHVQGIDPLYHRHGIGRKLMRLAEIHAAQNRIEVLMVKTLAASHPDPHYAKTRLFYEAVGFHGIEVLPQLWGEANPCLIMVKKIN